MGIHYLEIVTRDVDEVCAAYSEALGVRFGPPVSELGGACTADVPAGGRVGVRAPMHDAEEPILRPYWLVDDVQAAVDAAVAAGGELALPPMSVPGQGTFAIYIHGGVHHGLWQL